MNSGRAAGSGSAMMRLSPIDGWVGSARDQGGAAGTEAGVEAPAGEGGGEVSLGGGVGGAAPEVVAFFGIGLHVVELALVLVQVVNELPVLCTDHGHEVGAGKDVVAGL